MPAARARVTRRGGTPRDALADKLVLAGCGDEDAFSEVYDDTAPRVFGLALRVTGDPHHAEQVAQGAFVDIWRESARFDRTQGSAIAWMMALAHRRAVEHVRSTRAAVEAPVDARPPHVGPGRAVEPLAGLTGVQRRAVELAYLDGYTHGDVSGLMQEQPGDTLRRMGDALRSFSPQQPSA